MVSASDVKILRERTGVGMMDCKKALVEANGDMDKAADLLREKGLAKAAKKADRIAAEGVVGSFVCKECGEGVLVEVNCETDFVAKTDQFKEVVDKIAKQIAIVKPADVAALMASDCEGQTVEAMLTEATFKIGEKINIRRFVIFDGIVDSYIHMGGKIGVLSKFECPEDLAETEKFRTFAHDVSMHIAATNPMYVNETEIEPSVLEHEKSILTAQALNEGKPANIVEKMVMGRIQKFKKEICLLDQPFVKDPDITVGKLAKTIGDVNVVKFVRYEMGEGLEKREDDFVAEVMKQAGK